MIRMGKKLKMFRENFNLTQQQVADVLGIDRSTYAYYELGRTTPDLDKIDKLQRLYQVQYEDLIDYDEEREPVRVQDVRSNNPGRKKNYHKNADVFYQLTNDEQRLLLNFRLLSSTNKEQALQQLFKLRQQQKNN